MGRRMGMLRRDERGVSAVIVMVSLVGIFGAALLSLDFGNMWTTRRTIVSGTDSTALDQAIFAAKTSATDCNRVGSASFNSAYQDWTNILQINTNGFVSGSQTCTFTAVNAEGIIGYVGVEARKESDTRFGGLFGLGSSQPYSFSAARVFYPDAIKGLRPIGICLQNDHYQEWLNYIDNDVALPAPGSPGHPSYTGAGTVHHITWNKDQPDECGSGTPGNWGWQDFDGGSNSADDLKDWLLNGYNGLVNTPGDCNNDGSPDACEGDPGAQGGSNNSCNPSTVAGALKCISSSPGDIKEFPIVVYDTGNCAGGGANCEFNPYRYLWVRLWGFEVGGQEADRYFDFEFVPGVATGVCCETTSGQKDVKAVELCAVDHDNSGLTEAQRCGQ